MLFDISGNLLSMEKLEYTPYTSPRPGWAEQDTELIWKSLCLATTRLKQHHGDLFGKISGVGVTTQRDSMVCVDPFGVPLRPIITWLDQRKARPDFRLPRVLSPALRALGVEETLEISQSQGKCNWIRQNQPEIWEKTHKYLQISGFLHHRLTNRFADSTASQIGHIPFDYRRLKWAGFCHLNRILFPVEKEKLPELVSPGEIIGEITEKAHHETGIPFGTPVIACGSDKGCETIGMGVIDTDMASLSFGTTATVQTTTQTYCEPSRFLPPYPAPLKGLYNPEIEIFRGFWMITWFREEFAHREIMEAKEKGVAPEEVLNGLLSQSPPGAMGLMVQPYWGPGLKTPSAKGVILGFGDVHKKAHVYRAVIEGLGYALLEGSMALEKAVGKPFTKLAVSGGASRSDEICAIMANIFNLPLVRGKTSETSGLGAAIVTAYGMGIYKSFEQAIQNMVTHERTFTPDPDQAELYRELYSRVYTRIYKSLEPLYEEIRNITDYPERSR